MSATLTRQGHKPQRAANPREATDRLMASSFDLILMDVDMPEMDGISFTRLLADNPRFLAYQNVPIIMVTGKSDPGVMGDSFEAGAAFFLQKPFSPRELLDTVRMVLHTRG